MPAHGQGECAVLYQQVSSMLVQLFGMIWSVTSTYQRIADAIATDIQAGRWQPGGRIASEHELMEEFRVSRNTVRLALDVLTRTNLVRRHQGRGTFVAPQGVSHVLGGLRSFTEVIQDLGRTPGIDKVSVTPDANPPAEALEFLPGSFIWRVQRVRTSDGAPFALMQSWLPDAIASQITGDELLEAQSLYHLIEEKLGIRPASATEIIRAEAATAEEAKSLNTDQGGPLLTIYRWTSGSHGQPVEYVRSASPGDRYDIVVKLQQ